MLAAISHDLRNPLGTITLGTTLLLNQYGQEPKARRPLEMIQRAALRMQQLMERLTDLAGIQDGHLELELEDIPASELVACGLDGKQLETEQSIDNVTIRCDKRRVCHVLNLAFGDGLRDSGEPVRIHVMTRPSGQALFVIGEMPHWRSVEHYFANGIIAAHGGELWLEGASMFFTLPEA